MIMKVLLLLMEPTADTPRIDDDRYDKGDFLIKIDHHPNDDAYGDLCFWLIPLLQVPAKL